jgi:hypothetical protein
VGWDLDDYRGRAEGFLEELDREYYLHLAGHKPELGVEPIYERHADLFGREAVERVAAARRAASGEEAVRLRHLHRFALEGHIGAATRAEEARLAELEATLQVEVGGEPLPYRAAAITQANSPDPAQRAAIEEARNAALSEFLTPLHRAMLERAHAVCAELGWPSYLDAFCDLRGLDLPALAGQMEGFLRSTDGRYAEVVDPELELSCGRRLGELRRSDLPRAFRAPHLDPAFPADRLVDSFRRTLAGLGIDLDGQPNIRLDTESRPSKSPRAFCSTPRVPDEVYLVVPPVGGWEDFATLFHEGGHAEHYGCTEASLPFEFRHLGDNSVTESFAFLLQGLTAEPAWLQATIGAGDGNAVSSHARAVRLLMLRRYSAKIAYEVELHAPGVELDSMRDRYAALLTESVRVVWPVEPWLADVDPGFYAACYLRAWALEVSWRRVLSERFGERWFQVAEAGDWLRGLWAQGQRLDAEELVAEAGGSLDFEALASELVEI